MRWAASWRQIGKGDDALEAAQLNKAFTRELRLAFKYDFEAW